jgi:alkylation response protein AidB-like acyl-CoA dehydrogenase
MERKEIGATIIEASFDLVRPHAGTIPPDWMFAFRPTFNDDGLREARSGPQETRYSGMDFTLSEEQLAFKKKVHDFAIAEIAPYEHRWDESPEYFREVMLKLGSNGLLGLTVPSFFGGADMSIFDAALCVEEMAIYSPRAAHFIGSTSLGQTQYIQYFGTGEQKEKYLPAICRGETLVAIAITEETAGSASTDMTTSARYDGDDVVINGAKRFVSLVDDADTLVTYARFDGIPGAAGIGAILVNRSTPGLSVGQRDVNMAGNVQCEVLFNECRVPRSEILCGPGAYRVLTNCYNLERCGGCIEHVGSAQGALNKSIEYVKSREQFGRPIYEFQGLQWKIADMAIAVEAGRLLVYRALANAVDGFPVALDTSMAKVFITEMAQRVTSEAIQLHGATGYMRATGLERRYRSVRGASIAGGTVEIHRNMIAGWILEKRLSQRSKPITR